LLTKGLERMLKKISILIKDSPWASSTIEDSGYEFDALKGAMVKYENRSDIHLSNHLGLQYSSNIHHEGFLLS